MSYRQEIVGGYFLLARRVHMLRLDVLAKVAEGRTPW